MSDFALVVGLFVSAFGIGWSIGRGVKAIRQFFDLA
jgi:hypothetical protein